MKRFNKNNREDAPDHFQRAIRCADNTLIEEGLHTEKLLFTTITHVSAEELEIELSIPYKEGHYLVEYSRLGSQNTEVAVRVGDVSFDSRILTIL
ncbi:MAG: hypothetical protein KDA78_13400 [Planctomycetaceae bacterium]|nr:hypothetical protein [Planctomycetaceae bacterium]